MKKNKTTAVKGKLLISHKDLLELIQYVDQFYDVEKQEGMQLDGLHLIELDDSVKLVSNELLEDLKYGRDQYRKRKESIVAWDRMREYFWRGCLIMWACMILLNVGSKFIG